MSSSVDLMTSCAVLNSGKAFQDRLPAESRGTARAATRLPVIVTLHGTTYSRTAVWLRRRSFQAIKIAHIPPSDS